MWLRSPARSATPRQRGHFFVRNFSSPIRVGAGLDCPAVASASWYAERDSNQRGPVVASRYPQPPDMYVGDVVVVLAGACAGVELLDAAGDVVGVVDGGAAIGVGSTLFQPWGVSTVAKTTATKAITPGTTITSGCLYQRASRGC